MAPSRAYVPSVAILRALSRPTIPRIPLARRPPTQCLQSRGKRMKAKPSDQTPQNPVEVARSLGFKGRPLADHIGKDDDGHQVTVGFYEQDMDRVGEPRLVTKLETQEDVAKQRKIWKMHEEAMERAEDPEYDDTEVRKYALDELIKDPSFGHLREGLERMRKDLDDQEKVELEDDPLDAELEPELAEWDAQMAMTTHQAVQDMIDDPEYAPLRPRLEAFQRVLSASNDPKNSSKELHAELDRLNRKLEKFPPHQQRLAARAEEEAAGKQGQQDDLDGLDDSVTQEIIEQHQSKLQEMSELEPLLKQMKDVMAAMGTEEGLQNEMQEILDEDPTKGTEEEPKEMTLEDLKDQLLQLKQQPPTESPTEAGEETIDPKLDAMLDKIMQDPQLLQKLAVIKKMIESNKGDLTTIEQPSAPDPTTLDPSSLATYRDRRTMARNDPEHIIALRCLRINLLPPFNAAPAVKSLNQALELAYLGANDDVRRILWRAYSKARAIPTLLQNVPADAWDMLWYSQAVRWGSNQNRTNHLRVLLSDLKSVGRDGPPTHPDQLPT